MPSFVETTLGAASVLIEGDPSGTGKTQAGELKDVLERIVKIAELVANPLGALEVSAGVSIELNIGLDPEGHLVIVRGGDSANFKVGISVQPMARLPELPVAPNQT